MQSITVLKLHNVVSGKLSVSRKKCMKKGVSCKVIS